MKRKQTGFTLVELAIVLVIIGLLLAGILKGQELINSGKVKNLGADFRNVTTAYYGYMDKFRAIPGDDANVTTHLGATAVAGSGGTLGNGAIEGNWNAAISDATKPPESEAFWQHVRLAGLLAGSTTVANDSTYLPTNAEGGRLGITTTNPDKTASSTFKGAFYVCSGGVNGKMAKQLDATMDDGAGDKGSVRVFPSTLADTADPVADPLDATSYVVCAAF
ncbi:MAG: prepilin-type N-terminal cleavage/methylation domain-containing protein [Rhodocyclaceae bacterium]|nr:prepilin-type N-terminal cleavage/methylation domain-containing protein [Rhodocyclaceae bacterium]